MCHFALYHEGIVGWLYGMSLVSVGNGQNVQGAHKELMGANGENVKGLSCDITRMTLHE